MPHFAVFEQRPPRAIKGAGPAQDFEANFRHLGLIEAETPEAALRAYRAKRTLCVYPLAVEPSAGPL